MLCQSCAKRDRVTVATEVDHIIPVQHGGGHELTNLQSLCSSCHADKTLRERGIEPRRQIGIDGWPVDEPAVE